MPALQLSRNDERSQYEGHHDGELVSRAVFHVRGDVLTVTSTVTEPRWRGRGFAAQVTRYALDDARLRGLRVVPRCWFTADFIADNPEYADLVG